MKGDVFKALVQAAHARQPVVLGIITRVQGSSPQKLGAKAIFFPDGRIEGTLGGGCLEAEIQRRAIHSLSTDKAETFELLLDHDFGWDDGLICGGKVFGLILPNAQATGARFWADLCERKHTVEWGVKSDYSIALLHNTPGSVELLYRETVKPPWTLWIAGAGHISQAVAPLAAQLDFAVTVFDDRPALVNREFFPPSICLQSDVWERLLGCNVPPEPCFALIVTRGHRHDALVLRHWIQQPFVFLGMIGSARKARTIFDHFREERLATDEQLQRVACPVGIRIKSSTVMEIAVSIMAQFIERRAEVSAGSR